MPVAAAASGGQLGYLAMQMRLESLKAEAEAWGDITRLPDLDADNLPGAHVKADISLHKYCPAHWQERSWQERRLVLTCDSLLFAKPGSKSVIDAILLHDVVSIEFGTLSSFQTEEALRLTTLQQSSRALVQYGVHMAAALVRHPLRAHDVTLWMLKKEADDAWSRSVRKHRGAEHMLARIPACGACSRLKLQRPTACAGDFSFCTGMSCCTTIMKPCTRTIQCRRSLFCACKLTHRP